MGVDPTSRGDISQTSSDVSIVDDAIANGVSKENPETVNVQVRSPERAQEPQSARVDNDAAASSQPIDLGPWADLKTMLEDERRHVWQLRAASHGRLANSVDASNLEQLRHSDRERESASTDLLGLALSGGGIRSATFSFGVLQALAQSELIRQIDYISTVSGGGYIGAWLSACIYRARTEALQDPVCEIEARIAPKNIRRAGEEPTEIRFLRAYSNYLTPRLGLLSGDTLAALAGFARNLGLSLFLGVVSISVILALFHSLVAVAAIAFHSSGGILAALTAGGGVGIAIHFYGGSLVGALAASAVLSALMGIAFFVTFQAYDLRRLRSQNSDTLFILALFIRFLNFIQARPRWFVLAPLAFSLVVGSVWFASAPRPLGIREFGVATAGVLIVLGIGAWNALAVISLLDRFDQVASAPRASLYVLNTYLRAGDTLFVKSGRELARSVLAALVCASVLYAVAQVVSVYATPAPDLGRPIHIVALGPGLAVAGLWLLFFVWMGVVGNIYSEFTREWLNRLLGELAGFAVLWLVVTAIVIHARPAFQWMTVQFRIMHETILVFGPPVIGVVLLAIAWRKLGTSRQIVAGTEPRRPGITLVSWLAVLSIVTSVTVLYQSALIAFLPIDNSPAMVDAYSALLGRHLSELTSVLAVNSAAITGLSSWPLLMPSLTLLALLGVVAWLGFRVVDVNTFSIQNLYRNRLVRCYLGAAHYSGRLENPYAGFDPRDDLELQCFDAQRPYLLINAALNITQGQDLAWQQRKAASFIFSPRWCGYWLESTEMSSIVSRHPVKGGYVRTKDYVHEPGGFGEVSQGLMVGTAMATSGAAVSSQMGFASRGSLAFILTLINMRLGRWLPNPAAPTVSLWKQLTKGTEDSFWKQLAAATALRWKQHSPGFGAFWYSRELLGMTNERSDWIYLSDGGHFENLGIYELVRRRCGRIICVDAGADPRRTFADLGNAVQKCRVDFGVDVKVNTEPLRIGATDGRSESGYAIGTVVYPATQEAEEFEGIFLYIKPSIPTRLDELSADILSYRAKNPEFPHEPTRNQWFSESQFESYRRLGYVIGLNALKETQGKIFP